jgi:hypothetical protein
MYSAVISVNLMATHKSGEKLITDEYEKLITYNKLPFYKYVYFDVHLECANQKFEKVNPLIEKLSPQLTNFSFFLKNTDTQKVLSTQKGVFRTNCLDCLDRTNLVMTKLAAVVLQLQFDLLGLDLQKVPFLTRISPVLAL